METTLPGPGAAVNWNEIQDEILCPLCGYNLRQLTEPRCPECGFQFEWNELLDVRRRKHPYLYEHHPESRMGSYARTVLGALRPKRFWTALHPGQSASLRRLVVFLFVPLSLIIVLLLGGLVIQQTIRQIEYNELEKGYTRSRASFRDAESIAPDWDLETYLEYKLPTTFFANLKEWPRYLDYNETFHEAVFISLTLFLWPILTFGALLIFFQTRRRAKLKKLHLLRCVAYSSDPVLLLGLALAALIGWRGDDYFNNVWLGRNCLLILVPAALILATYSLTAALKHYLNYRHAAMTAVLTQLIYVMVVTQTILLPVFFR